MVTCFSCMASSRALCTLAGARLISSGRTRWAKTGAFLSVNSPVRGLKICVPITSAGNRAGGNWMRLKLRRSPRAAAGVSEKGNRRGGGRDGRGRAPAGERKVRAPQDAVVGNAHRPSRRQRRRRTGKVQQKAYRRWPGFGRDQVRVKRRGKSPP